MRTYEVVLHSESSDEQCRITVEAENAAAIRVHPRILSLRSQDMSIVLIKEKAAA